MVRLHWLVFIRLSAPSKTGRLNRTPVPTPRISKTTLSLFYVRFISAQPEDACCVQVADICCVPNIAYEATRSTACAGTSLSRTSYLNTSAIHFWSLRTIASGDNDKL